MGAKPRVQAQARTEKAGGRERQWCEWQRETRADSMGARHTVRGIAQGGAWRDRSDTDARRTGRMQQPRRARAQPVSGEMRQLLRERVATRVARMRARGTEKREQRKR